MAQGVLPHWHLPGAGSIAPIDEASESHRDIDPRGLVKLWEPPKPRARYVMGIDVAGGIEGWTRAHRTKDDLHMDNGAIVVLRCGDGQTTPDVQVAEYAAPIPAGDLADVAALLGRLYAGSSEYEEALCIIETWPGPGLLTHQELVHRFAYQNLWRWEYLDTVAPRVTNSYGWTSNVRTLQLLWSRFHQHLGKGLVQIRSPWLRNELGMLRHQPGKTFPLPPEGGIAHDDRVRAAAMSVWASHRWSLAEQNPEPKQMQTMSRPRWEASDCTLEQMLEEWEEQFQELADDY